MHSWTTIWFLTFHYSWRFHKFRTNQSFLILQSPVRSTKYLSFELRTRKFIHWENYLRNMHVVVKYHRPYGLICTLCIPLKFSSLKRKRAYAREKSNLYGQSRINKKQKKLCACWYACVVVYYSVIKCKGLFANFRSFNLHLNYPH